MKPPVIIVEYNHRWPIMYEEEKAQILSVIGGKILAIEHIGSTAVPGLGGKPIIDVMVGVRRLADAEEPDKEKIIEQEWEQEGRFEFLPPYEKKGLKLIVLITREKTPEGILGNRIHIIEEKDQMRVEVASVLDLFKWTWQDYVSVLKKAGFREVYSAKENGRGAEPYILNIGVK